MLKKIIIFCFLIMPLACAAVQQMPSPLLISQVQITGGKNKTGDDFIEIFNPNPSAVNLKGYRLVKRGASSQTDSSIKVWTKDTLIPASSFYLWANAAFTSITVKPDITTSATISDDSGVALRFGGNDSGTIIDSLAWGKSGNGFANVSPTNPGAGQAISRRNLTLGSGDFIIALAHPRNSLVSGLLTSQNDFQPPPENPLPKNTSSKPPAPKSIKTQAPVLASSEPDTKLSTANISDNQESPTSSSTAFAGANDRNQTEPANNQGIKFLILAGIALFLLFTIVVKYFWKNRDSNK